MNIPEKINISGMEYKVNLTDEVLLTSDNHRAYGHINFEDKIITIDKGLREEQEWIQTLLHEIIHGIVQDREIDFHEDHEETIVNQLSKGLFQVLKDNELLP